MIKKDLILYGLVGAMVVAGFYYVGIEYSEERMEQYNESRQVAANWATVTEDETTCEEMQANLIALGLETFDGRELITEAIWAKYEEFGC